MPDDLPAISADERMVEQVLLDLLSNGRRPGAVELAARGTSDDGLIVTGKDTGIGIGRESFAKIVQPFGQVDSSLQVALHHGGIGLESEITWGATKRIALPKVRA